LALAGDVPGVSIAPLLRASPAGHGAVDLEVTVTRDPVQAFGLVQNTGAESLGRWSALARVDFNSFTANGERTSLVVLRTIGGEQQVVQLLEEARLGSEGLVGRLSVASGTSRPGGELASLDLEGRSLAV